MVAGFDCLKAQNAKLLAGQEEMLPLVRRMTGIADFFEECIAAGLKARDFVSMLQMRQEVVVKTHSQQTGGSESLVLEMQSIAPRSASVRLIEAGGPPN